MSGNAGGDSAFTTKCARQFDRERFDLVLRLCYRATWDVDQEQGEHLVYYPKTADPDAEYFERVARADREALPFASLEARSRPLDIGTRGEFRRLVETAGGGDFSKARWTAWRPTCVTWPRGFPPRPRCRRRSNQA